MKEFFNSLKTWNIALTAIAAGSESAGWEAFTTAAVGAEG
jgi:hypothetical protein